MVNMRKQDLTGNKYGRITVLASAPKRPNSQHQYWKCRCQCGKEWEVRHSHLTGQKVRSCGCSHFYIGEKHPHWSGIGEIPGTFYASLRLSARSRNLKLKVSLEELWQLFLKQKRKCALSGLELTFNKIVKDRSGTASLDRIDSNQDYTIDNVQFVHKWINLMKSDMTTEEFVNYCQLVVDNYKKL